MHAAYHKISAKDRDVAPRYYYKKTKSYTFLQRARNALRRIAAFLFTQVGVCGLVAVYTFIGAGKGQQKAVGSKISHVTDFYRDSGK